MPNVALGDLKETTVDEAVSLPEGFTGVASVERMTVTIDEWLADSVPWRLGSLLQHFLQHKLDVTQDTPHNDQLLDTNHFTDSYISSSSKILEIDFCPQPYSETYLWSKFVSNKWVPAILSSD
jgi:hypothetical protein